MPHAHFSVSIVRSSPVSTEQREYSMGCELSHVSPLSHGSGVGLIALILPESLNTMYRYM